MSNDSQSSISEEILELSIKLADAEARAKASEYMIQALLKTIENIQSSSTSCCSRDTKVVSSDAGKTTIPTEKSKNKNEKYPTLRKDIDAFTFKLPEKLESFIYEFCENKNFNRGLADFIMLVSYYTILTRKSKEGVGINNKIVSDTLGGYTRFDWKGNTPLIKFIKQENGTKKYDLTFFMKQQLSDILKELSSTPSEEIQWGTGRNTLIAKTSKTEETALEEVVPVSAE